MVGVGEDDLCGEFLKCGLRDAFHGRERADRHEDWTRDGSVSSLNAAKPGGAVVGSDFERKRHLSFQFRGGSLTDNPLCNVARGYGSRWRGASGSVAELP